MGPGFMGDGAGTGIKFIPTAGMGMGSRWYPPHPRPASRYVQILGYVFVWDFGYVIVWDFGCVFVSDFGVWICIMDFKAQMIEYKYVAQMGIKREFDGWWGGKNGY